MGDTDSVFWRCADMLNYDLQLDKRKETFENIDKKIDNHLRKNNLPDTITLASEEFISKFSASCSKKSYYRFE
jgi:hypothetical protein